MTTNKGREWLWALRDIPSKAASDTLETLKEIVDDMNRRNEKKGEGKKAVGETDAVGETNAVGEKNAVGERTPSAKQTQSAKQTAEATQKSALEQNS